MLGTTDDSCEGTLIVLIDGRVVGINDVGAECKLEVLLVNSDRTSAVTPISKKLTFNLSRYAILMNLPWK